MTSRPKNDIFAWLLWFIFSKLSKQRKHSTSKSARNSYNHMYVLEYSTQFLIMKLHPTSTKYTTYHIYYNSVLTNMPRLPLLPHMSYNWYRYVSSFWLLETLLENSLDTLALLYSPLPPYILETNTHYLSSSYWELVNARAPRVLEFEW